MPAEKARPVRIPLFGRRPTVDGRLDEPAWTRAAVFDRFVQIEPGDNTPPSEPTEVLVGYDPSHLYLGFRAHAAPGTVRATIPPRDSVFEDDHVGVLLDTFDDWRRAYALYFNPFGVQADGIYTEQTEDEDRTVDIVLESRGVVDSGGYTVEVAIPFESLRYRAGEGRRWGVHFFRVLKRYDNERDSWMPVRRRQPGLLRQAGHITGLDRIADGHALEVTPTVAASHTGERVPPRTEDGAGEPPGGDPARFASGPVRYHPGVSARLGLTSAVTLDLTVNPDFAEVEADEPVITANQRFPIFFPEKRPFFLERSDIFRTSLRPVHTRAIVDPDAAVKLTGTRGRSTFGLLLASDAAPGNLTDEERLAPESRSLSGRNATVGVLRLKRDVGQESSVGLIATGYEFPSRHSYLAGVDGRFRLGRRSSLSFELLGTTSREPFYDAELDRSVYRTGAGFGYDWTYRTTGRHLSFEASGRGRTRDYRASVGFTQRTNTNAHSALLGYHSEPKPGATLISWSLSSAVTGSLDWQGRVQSWDVYVQLGLAFARETALDVSIGTGFEQLFEEEFGPVRTPSRPGAFFGRSERAARRQSVIVSASTRPSRSYAAALEVGRTWGAFDHDLGAGVRFKRVSPAALQDPAAPLDPGPGDSWDVRLSLQLQPTSALNFSLGYTKARLVRDDTERVAFDDNIYSARAVYRPTPSVFVRARGDYTTLDARVYGQLLFGWVPTPGTSVYVSYEDDLSYNGSDPFTGEPERGLRRNRRTLALKISYLLRMDL